RRYLRIGRLWTARESHRRARARHQGADLLLHKRGLSTHAVSSACALARGNKDHSDRWNQSDHSCVAPSLSSSASWSRELPKLASTLASRTKSSILSFSPRCVGSISAARSACSAACPEP